MNKDRRHHHHADLDFDGIKTVADLIPAALNTLMDGAEARREKRLRALRSIHQRSRAGETENKGGNR